MRLDSTTPTRGRTAAPFLAVVGAALAAGTAGFWMGQPSSQGSLSPSPRPTAQAQARIDGLAARLGQMQAEVTRLNSVATQLARQAGLDPALLTRPAGAGGGPERVSLRSNNLSAVEQDLAKVLGELDDRSRKLALLETLIRDRDLSGGLPGRGGRGALPSGWPLVSGGVITSEFGIRRHPITGRRAMHTGLDISGEVGAEIVAMADGVVTFSGRKSGYGNIVEIRHANGMETRYAHNLRNLVSEGTLVRKGQTIALLGNTGRSTGPHVHLEVRRNGEALDPMPYLDQRDHSTRLARL